MDNASKALIMAGAILISVAIVGIGIYIFSVANTMTNDAVNEMESTQVSMFNNTFYRYANDKNTIKGTRARELINHANSQTVKLTGLKEIPSDGDRKNYKVTYHYSDTGSGYIDEVNISEDKGTKD